jgi:hypothetical protein
MAFMFGDCAKVHTTYIRATANSNLRHSQLEQEVILSLAIYNYPSVELQLQQLRSKMPRLQACTVTASNVSASQYVLYLLYALGMFI